MPDETKALDAQAAAKRAAVYLNAMMPQAEEILLEEVEKETDSGSTYWLITLSFQLNLSGIPSAGLRGLQFAMGKRDYKTFKIDASTGDVVSMKIKTV